jgi:murein DD-endopeptidase MepM/ murein hydrolase activator NlpD
MQANITQSDRVRRGQVLALLGNTGNSSEPHLHFHVIDRNAAFDAEGVPYAFESFELEAAGEQVTPPIISVSNSLGIDPSVMVKWRAGSAPHRERETPLRNAIVKFPD